MIMTLSFGTCTLLAMAVYAVWDQCKHREPGEKPPSNELLYSLI